ncbi:MAG: MMPL family transporter [Acidimicrobiia bacterium]
MLGRIAELVIVRRRAVLVGAVVLFAVGGALGGNVAQHLSAGGFEDPGSESFQADQALLDRFDAGVPNLVLVLTAPPSGATGPDGTPVLPVDDLAAAADGVALTERVAAIPDVTDVVSYWSVGGQAPLRSEDGEHALLVARILGTQDAVDERVREIVPELEAAGGSLEVEVTGYAEIFRQVSDQIEHDLIRAETIALPVTLLLLLVVFRGVVAAALPLAIGALSVVGTFLVLRGISEVTEVSVFALNLTTAMGLGLSIDYALFVVNRFREELSHGHEPHVAVRRTVRTAGRTVAFSAGTVAASLLALLVFPVAFLKSFAYAGVAVAGLAGLFSVVVLPAMLAALGHRVNALSIRRRRDERPEEEGFWYRTASRVMARPVGIATAVVVVLVVLGLPFLGIDLGLPDDRVLPESAPARAAADVIRDEFRSNEAGASSVVATDVGDTSSPAVREALDAYARQLSALDGAERVDALTGIYADGQQLLDAETAAAVAPEAIDRFQHPDSIWVSVVPDHEPNSATGEAFVSAIRDVPAPFDDVRVTGPSAQLVDSKAALLGRMPLALAIIAGITFALLFLLFGSVVVPLKALVLNVLSLSATFGAMVWIFQDGNLSDVLGFTATGTIDASTPILMFCVAFGLSMDYEVFLLSRIKEEHDAGADDRRAVALGLERTGRIVTAAALLIAVVFLAFGTSEVTFIKLFGLGLALAVLTDAFLIRGTLVPAFMRLAGGANWWAPAPLRRLHDRIGVSEHVDLDGYLLEGAPTRAGTVDPVLVEPAPRPRRSRPLVAAGRTAPWERDDDG